MVCCVQCDVSLLGKILWTQYGLTWAIFYTVDILIRKKRLERLITLLHPHKVDKPYAYRLKKQQADAIADQRSNKAAYGSDRR